MHVMRRIIGPSLLLALGSLGVQNAFAMRSRVISINPKATVFRVDLETGESHEFIAGTYGGIWVALDHAVVITSHVNGEEVRSEIQPGAAKAVDPKMSLRFQSRTPSGASVIWVQANLPHQELTVSSFTIDKSLDDGSDRNATLLIALTDCRLDDVMNLGDESRWIPGRHTVLSLPRGSARWVRPGIHHLRRIGSVPARIVLIEW